MEKKGSFAAKPRYRLDCVATKKKNWRICDLSETISENKILEFFCQFSTVSMARQILPKIITGVLFPVGIFLSSCLVKSCLLGIRWLCSSGCCPTGSQSSSSATTGLWSWSNFVGCVFTVYMFSFLTQLFAREPYLSYVQGISVTKIDLKQKPEVAFLRAIPAN